MIFDKKSLVLYAITDRAWTDKMPLTEQVKLALQGGVTCVQLREKELDEESFVKEAVEIKKICSEYGVPLIINDNVNVAVKSGADGVHVGIEDTPVAEIRRKVGRNFIIGATAKTASQALTAEKEGADYLGVGAVFPSPTKQNALRITNENLREICLSVSIPCVAIGGITLANIEKIKNCHISGVAVVSAIFSADDIKTAAEQLKNKAEQII